MSFYDDNKINIEKAEKIIHNFEKDKDGNIIIKDGTYIISQLKTDQYNFTNGWILLSQPGVINREDIQGKMALVKSYIPDKCPGFYKGSDIEILRANNFIMTEIAKQFELEAAEYYNVVFEESDELNSKENNKKVGRKNEQRIKPNTRYLLTPTFRKNNERMVHLGDILSSENELNAAKMIKDIQKYLRKEKVAESDIDMVIKSFIKQCIFNKYIGFSDEHNYNSGILITNDKKEKRARLAPCYDLDFSADIYNFTNGGIRPKYFLRNNGYYSTTLKGMLALFNTKFERDYLKDIIPNIDIEEAIKVGEQNGNFKLSKIAREKYMYFFKQQQEDLEEFYEEYCNPKVKKSEEKESMQGEAR